MFHNISLLGIKEYERVMNNLFFGKESDEFVFVVARMELTRND
jgi:hypothetical protein